MNKKGIIVLLLMLVIVSSGCVTEDCEIEKLTFCINHGYDDYSKSMVFPDECIKLENDTLYKREIHSGSGCKVYWEVIEE